MEMHQLPGQLSAEMMESLFDLPDARFPSVDNDLFVKNEMGGDMPAVSGDMRDIQSVHSVHSDISPLNATASPEGDTLRREPAAGGAGDEPGTNRDRYSTESSVLRRHTSLRRPSTGSRHSIDGRDGAGGRLELHELHEQHDPSRHDSRHDNSRHDQRRSVGYGENGVDPTIFYSPALGPLNDSTPLMSPRDLPLDRPDLSADFSMPPAAYSSPSGASGQTGPGSASSAAAASGKRKLAAGRVSKASPQIRARPRATHARSSTTSPKEEDEVTDLYMPPAHEHAAGGNGGNGGGSASGGFDARPSAATPATLMNIYQQAPADVPPSEMEERLTSAILATQTSSSLSRRSSQRSSPASTPGLTPRMTPGMLPLGGDRRVSAASVSSVSSAVTPGMRARPGSRIGSVSLSPAIVPTPGAASGSPGDDMAHVLAAKSNIQSLMDGSHHQMGLQYPDRLASELSNKKTNHKMAEQERRNRMNSALVELGRLVETEGTPSKAAMVEAAISHIVMLNQHVASLEAQVRSYGGTPAPRPPK